MFRRGRYALLAVALSFGLWGVSALDAGEASGRHGDPTSAAALTRSISVSPGAARLPASVVAMVAAAAGLHLLRRRLRPGDVARLPLWTAWSDDPARWRAPPVAAS